MARFYHLYANGKTVREISWEEWRKISNADFKRLHTTRLICRIDKTSVYLRKGKHSLWLRRGQLEEILRIDS